MTAPTTGSTAVETFDHHLREYTSRIALWWRGDAISYSQLLEQRSEWVARLKDLGVGPGTVCAYVGDYWPDVVASSLALISLDAIGVPFSTGMEREIPKLAELAGVELLLRVTPDGDHSVENLSPAGPHALVAEFRKKSHPGCIVFTSGSTGEPKGILHDYEALLGKFLKPRTPHRTLLFLLLDHLGGINTLLSVLSSGGTAVVAEKRTVEEVAKVVERARVSLLPVTPAFLTTLLASGVQQQFDFSSVSLITYGTDAMPEATLRQASAAFPHARLQQTYGLSEVGVLRSKSKSSDSLMLSVGGEGFETKIEDGVLYIRSASAMVGYLNAPSPFDKDGWLNTGDRVVVEGEYIRILGRESDLINVGGQKVFPIEVEEVLMDADNVLDCTVRGEKHPVLGAVVTATVSLREPEDPIELRRRLRAHCLTRLAAYKVPIRFTITAEKQHNERFKKTRRES